MNLKVNTLKLAADSQIFSLLICESAATNGDVFKNEYTS